MAFLNLFKPNIRKLEKKGDIEGLIGALGHKDESVRVEAVWSLARIGDKRSPESLYKIYQEDSSPYVRRQAALGLVDLGDDRGFDFVVADLNSSDKWVRHGAVERLRKLRSPRAIEPLMSLLQRNSFSDDASFARTVLIKAGWKTDAEIDQELRRARAASEPARCLHLSQHAIDQLCRDCGAVLSECKDCGAWFHLRASSTCNTY